VTLPFATFPDEGHLRPHRNTLSTPQAPDPTPHGHLGAWVNDVLLAFRCMRRLNPVQFYSNFYYFYICLSVLKMYWVVLTVRPVSRLADNFTAGLAQIAIFAAGYGLAFSRLKFRLKSRLMGS